MKITIRGGHNFQVTGASALIDETTEDRKVKDAVIKYLNIAGHEVLDVTPGNCDVNTDLIYGVDKANNWGADFFISIHFNKAYNSYNGAIGTETWIYSTGGKAEPMAQRIVNKLSSLGFKNRGIKINPKLYELKETDMSAIIVEVCFVEATEDVQIYKEKGYDLIGKMIAEGIVGKSIAIQEQVTKEVASASEPYIVPTEKNITPLNGGIGWIETLENRVIIHFDKYNYVSIQDNGVFAYSKAGSVKII
jgi:N-acetylmuramoyl-L-alanine amidase